MLEESVFLFMWQFTITSTVMQGLSLLRNFIHQSLKTGALQIQLLLAVFRMQENMCYWFRLEVSLTAFSSVDHCTKVTHLHHCLFSSKSILSSGESINDLTIVPIPKQNVFLVNLDL